MLKLLPVMANKPRYKNRRSAENMNRIMIIGCGGSGKSVLASNLGEKLSLPVHHLDRLFWQPGWQEPSKEKFRVAQENLCAQPKWILDGNYGGTMDVRFATVDTIIFLDVSTFMCFFGAIQRFLRFRGRSRPDMTDGCLERLTWNYLKWIFKYRRDRRPKILFQLDKFKDEKNIAILKSRYAIKSFLNTESGGISH